MSQLVSGKIPQGSVCPFTKECSFKEFGTCGHKGEKHPSDYSCGTARGFDVMQKDLIRKSA